MNKDIFVWKSYGDVTVYDVSTLEKRISLLELIRKAAYFLDSDCSDCNSVIECIDKVGEYAVTKPLNTVQDLQNLNDKGLP